MQQTVLQSRNIRVSKSISEDLGVPEAEWESHEMPKEKDIFTVQGILESNRGRKSPLMHVLHDVQRELGFIPPWAQKLVARDLKLSFSEIHGVVSFYNFFSQRPKGRHTIQLCQGTACYVRGGKLIMNQLKRRLDVKPGETTKDGRFSLEIVRCLGCCGLAPVMTVDGDVYRKVNPEKIGDILEDYR